MTASPLQDRHLNGFIMAYSALVCLLLLQSRWSSAKKTCVLIQTAVNKPDVPQEYWCNTPSCDVGIENEAGVAAIPLRAFLMLTGWKPPLRAEVSMMSESKSRRFFL